MSSLLGFHLDVRLASDGGSPRQVTRAFLEVVADSAWWPDPQRCGATRVTSRAHGIDLLLGAERDVVALRRGAAEPSEASAWITCAPTGWPAPGVDVTIFHGSKASRGEYAQLREATSAVATALGSLEAGGASSPLIVSAVGVDVPHRRPPRSSPWWRPGLIHVTADRVAASPDVSLARAAARVLSATPLAQRTRIGALVLDEWVTPPLDLPALEEALARQAAWYADLLELPPDVGWNNLGDREVPLYGAQEAPSPLAWYVPADKRGMLPVVPDPEGSLAAVIPAVVSEWRGARRLPDGRELDRVDVVFPRRQDAVRLRSEAKSLGFARTLYVHDGTLWNIHPLGRWWTPS